MIIPIKKTAWVRHGASYILSRSLLAGGYTGTQYKDTSQYWVCFDGTTSPRFDKEYQAAGWFRERVAKLLEGA